MDTLQSEDGQNFIRSLAQFIRQHEKALANSLQLSVQRKHGSAKSSPTSFSSIATGNSNPLQSSSNPLAAALSFAGLHFRSHSIKAAHLTLTPHHLFYLLSKIEELDIDVGSMNVRLENLNHDSSPANYISFLPGHKSSGAGRSDNDSIHSVSSVRSVMSSMTAFWSSIGLGATSSKNEKAKAAAEADLKYLYSAFTKLPSLRLTSDPRARLILGFEEFPFDTAVPLFAFKNVQQLDIVDLDFRQFYGWDRLAENLTLLTVKRGHLNDPSELLTDVVLDDAERRRKRSTKGGRSPSVPVTSRSMPSTPHTDCACSHSEPSSPADVSPQHESAPTRKDTASSAESASPKRPPVARTGSSYRHVRSYSSKATRSGSGSSNSSEYSVRPYRSDSASNLLAMNVLPPTKWQRLKYLSLADNSLTSISAKSLGPIAGAVRSLNLSSNLFTEIPDSLASLTKLVSLDLSNCMISSLQSLSKSPLPAITSIKLKSNRLESLAGVERLLSLENINVQDNLLSDPLEAARLTGLPNLRKIWLRGNPFVKPHASYRVKIFNLFRSTPGYVEDIVIDDYGPGYAEKKLLVERVPEIEHRLSQPKIRIAETPVIVQSYEVGGEASNLVDGVSVPARRRKVSRRRIVDLAQEDSPWRSNPDATVIVRQSLDSSQARRGNVDAAAPEKANDDMVNDQRHEDILGRDCPTDNTTTTTAAAAARSQQDPYRMQAEALRRELGSNWLSALGDQSWHNNHLLEVQRGQSFTPVVPLHRANSLGPTIVGGGRTLG